MDYAYTLHVPKVVLMDWPRDATEYIRRVGRTARANQGGSILTLLCGNKEATMGKQITAAAIRSQRLTTQMDKEKTRCLERGELSLFRFEPVFRST